MSNEERRWLIEKKCDKKLGKKKTDGHSASPNFMSTGFCEKDLMDQNHR